MNVAPLLETVEWTDVRYTKGDHLGHFLAWISLVPVFISFAGFLSHLIFRRELQGLFFFLGHVISMLSTNFIKDIVKQARPQTCAMLGVCHSYGWPSNHSQFTTFFASYVSLLTYRRLGLCNGKFKWVGVALAWCLAFLTMYSRVYLGYHTFDQVVAGAFLGFVLGIFWFWLGYSFIFCCFPAIENCKLCRMFCIKDTSHIPDVMKFEYENSKAARKAKATGYKCL
ncbi:hypothetical protein I3843_10G128700 [Carya illinoinensis]|uniref:Phosphatidic acid phosphatase type 2/haloperoxidase domain-containing protein n=1 Tax=Carya illinoinensis TaxID=32201 RepID=A0A8T1PB48_CARIL|nr:lipid phosphate phosphatase gamma-like [Carya illinoinensis]KAG6639935.1 hypothetical protein CIPAW_10G136900 [Carya illinoinensis]KAG7960530.1 hypothetical protein I3843_10G128700 [Carya illinoinensis]